MIKSIKTALLYVILTMLFMTQAEAGGRPAVDTALMLNMCAADVHICPRATTTSPTAFCR